jgi:glycogen debranching enzyme
VSEATQSSGGETGGTALGAAQAGTRLHVLKHGDMFAVCDVHGDMVGRIERTGATIGPDGLFQDDTRILSRWELKLAGAQPVLLGSHVSGDNVLLVVDFTNPPLSDATARTVAEGTLHVRRSRFLWERRMYEEIRVHNYDTRPVRLPLELHFEADFRDVFEVRGAVRGSRGEALPDRVAPGIVELAYRGRDQRTRTVTLAGSPSPKVRGRTQTFELEIPAREERFVLLVVGTEGPPARPPDRTRHRQAAAAARRAMRHESRRGATIATSNEVLDAWLRRARTDLALLVTDLDTGPYPYAGIPWFSTAFGRDAIITALEVLWLDPTLARGVLSYLAARQATEVSAFRDAEPGKILHETRKGEMALLGEVPFHTYYGGVDTTPLFVLLAGAYFERTGDLAFVRSIWPAIEAALAWIETAGDADGDGFVEYERQADTGLANQGWKDSHDSIFHADGADAPGPIALCEVQAYVYAARLAAAEIAAALGSKGLAGTLREQAAALRERFEQAFWDDELGSYVLALDGRKRPCRVRTSNAGYALFCGIASPERARRAARQLLTPDSFSGWGVRTVAASEARYNPMSYHNGSIWPHDNAIVAGGLGRYGLTAQAARLLGALFDAAAAFDAFRLPELFCGFPRRAGEEPTTYPVACLPQAWASGAVYLLLQASLGIAVDGRGRRIVVTSPTLPSFVDEVVVRGLQVGEGWASLRFATGAGGVEISLLETTGDVALVLRDRAHRNLKA